MEEMDYSNVILYYSLLENEDWQMTKSDGLVEMIL